MASSTFSKVFEVVKYDLILCLTGTLERLDGKEEIIKQYAPVCDQITFKEALENGWVSPIKNYLVLLDVDLTEYNQLNNAFNGFFSFFGWDFNLAMKAATDYKFRLSYSKQLNQPLKVVNANAFGFLTTLKKRKKFIQSHPKKIEICKKILNARTDKKCITFSATIKDAESIGIGEVLHSKKSKKTNEEILKTFNDSKKGVINSSKALDTGVDCKGLSVGIILSTDSSKIRATQRIGRVIRKEENKEAEFFTLVIKGTQELNWFLNSNTTEYITINEQQLENVLNYENLDIRKRELTSNVKYRF